MGGSYPTLFLRQYAHWKTVSDPVYRLVFEQLRDTAQPVIDVGCGIGLLELYLRKRGFDRPITGIDHDERKVEAARRANAGGNNTFIVCDVRAPLPAAGNVVLLDVLHYFTPADQALILRNALTAVPAGGALLLREGLRDDSLRYRATHLGEVFARRNGWLKAERLNFPTCEEIRAHIPESFSEKTVERCGPLLFNNYFLVYRRSA